MDEHRYREGQRQGRLFALLDVLTAGPGRISRARHAAPSAYLVR
jgi:hypothetical protein